MPRLARGIVAHDIKGYTLQLNSERSKEYTDSQAQLRRRAYRLAHPTEIIIDKCMDGRLNLSVFTQVPRGILQPFRNVGGKFDLGWPLFQEVMKDCVEFAQNQKRPCIVITSYHFSKGSHDRGCAGFGYDTESARHAAFALRDQYTRVFGVLNNNPVYALTIGIETDFESLIFHGNGCEVLNVAELAPDVPSQELEQLLANLYPDLRIDMRRDLLPLVEGNLRHIAEVRAEQKPLIDHEHREQIIAVGRGFDWLHEPNRALIIGPYSHEWPEAVHTAGTIVLDNLRKGRVPEESGVLLLISSLWRREEGEVGRRLKEEKTRYVARTALEKLQAMPELHRHLEVVIGVVHADTRKLHELDPRG